MTFYEIVQRGEPYVSQDEVLGYADNEEAAKHMVEQCKVFMRDRYNPPEFFYREVPVLNYLLKKPQ